MKKILLFIAFVSLCSSIIAQDLSQFKNVNEEQIQPIIDSMLNLQTKQYMFSETVRKHSEYIHIYTNADNKEDELLFTFYYLGGYNADLEIEKTKKWTLKRVSGRFLALFPIWQKYIDPDADKEKTAKDKRATTDIGRFTRMYKVPDYSSFWILDI